jgi:hypothetical protein
MVAIVVEPPVEHVCANVADCFWVRITFYKAKNLVG